MTERESKRLRELFARLSGGDITAFDEIYEGYFKIYRDFAYTKVGDEYFSDEIAQEAFTDILKQRKESLSRVREPKSYLFKIVSNKSNRHIKKICEEREISKQQADKERWRLRQRNFEESMPSFSCEGSDFAAALDGADEPDFEKRIETAEDYYGTLVIDEMTKNLTERQRRIFYSVYIEGKTWKEAHIELKMNIRTLSREVKRIKDKVKKNTAVISPVIVLLLLLVLI